MSSMKDSNDLRIDLMVPETLEEVFAGPTEDDYAALAKQKAAYLKKKND